MKKSKTLLIVLIVILVLLLGAGGTFAYLFFYAYLCAQICKNGAYETYLLIVSCSVFNRDNAFPPVFSAGTKLLPREESAGGVGALRI